METESKGLYSQFFEHFFLQASSLIISIFKKYFFLFFSVTTVTRLKINKLSCNKTVTKLYQTVTSYLINHLKSDCYRRKAELLQEKHSFVTGKFFH